MSRPTRPPAERFAYRSDGPRRERLAIAQKVAAGIETALETGATVGVVIDGVVSLQLVPEGDGRVPPDPYAPAGGAAA